MRDKTINPISLLLKRVVTVSLNAIKINENIIEITNAIIKLAEEVLFADNLSLLFV